MTVAAGAVGAYVTSVAQHRGWQVTGLARAEDEEFVRGLSADNTTHAEPGWDAVADGTARRKRGLDLVRDGGTFLGVRPADEPTAERGITVTTVVTYPDGPRLGGLLTRTTARDLPARVHAIVPQDQVADTTAPWPRAEYAGLTHSHLTSTSATRSRVAPAPPSARSRLHRRRRLAIS